MKLEPANIACPVCGNSNYMRHLIGNNIGYYDTKCLNCLSYFNYEEIAAEALDGKDIKVPTNADRIRAMSDEELASKFADIYCPNGLSTNHKNCKHNYLTGPPIEICEECWLEWLRQPSEN